MNVICRSLLASMLVACGLIQHVWGIEPVFERQFRANDSLPGDNFGAAVAISGRLGLVGAPLRNEAATHSGAAYLFDLVSGQQLAKFVPGDGAADDEFGTALSLSDQFAIIGAMHDDDDGRSSGSAYVFDVQTGAQLFKLTAADGQPGDEFGVSVGVHGTTAIVGAHMDGEGSAYFFDLTTGQQIRKIKSEDAAPDDLFGVAVAIDGPHALVGARYDDDNDIASGSAYIFDVATGQQLHKLTALDGAWGDRFGQYLDLHGDRAVVASRYDDDVLKSSGSAYIFDVGTGQQLFKIVADDATPNDHFGSAVSVTDQYTLIGAVNHDGLGLWAGAAYLYDVDTGEQLSKLVGDDTQAYDQFGYAVAMNDDLMLIGAPMLDFPGGPAMASGKVYLFRVPEPSTVIPIGFAFLVLVFQQRHARRRC